MAEEKEYKNVELIPFALAVIAEKYPLAMDTIKFPVRYDSQIGWLMDNQNTQLLDLGCWGIDWAKYTNEQAEKVRDSIGEMIAELLNGCNPQ